MSKIMFTPIKVDAHMQCMSIVEPCAPIYENYTKPIFEVKYLKKGVWIGGGEIYVPVFLKRALFGQYQMLP